MLTPEFELSQDYQYIIVTLRVRRAKASDVEIHIDGPQFCFYMKPYYLRLSLPGDLVEDGREKASYNPDDGLIVVHAPKAKEGEWFDGLDMLTTLLAPSCSQRRRRPTIEEMGSSECKNLETSHVNYEALDGLESADGDDDWFIEQELPQDQMPLLSEVKYGFANRLSGFFAHCEDFAEVVDVPDPDHTPLAERRRLRVIEEKQKFNPEHYLYDLFGNDEIESLLQYKPPYCQILSQYELQTPSEVSGDAAKNTVETREHPSVLVKFTANEKEMLKRLPNREYLLDVREERAAYLGLVDIIFCYAYNHRTTEGENTVESPWTVGKLSPSLCWLDTFTSLSDLVITCCRRSLIYPLYCHFKLTQSILVDLQTIFDLGRCQIVKCLLELHHMIERDETWRFLNDLYITDLCVWAQRSSHRKLQKIAERLQQFELKRDDINLDLEELESTVVQAIDEEANNCLDDNEEECECQSETSDGNTNSRGNSSSEDISESETSQP